jgi:hypothetical protein
MKVDKECLAGVQLGILLAFSRSLERDLAKRGTNNELGRMAGALEINFKKLSAEGH